MNTCSQKVSSQVGIREVQWIAAHTQYHIAVIQVGVKTLHWGTHVPRQLVRNFAVLIHVGATIGFEPCSFSTAAGCCTHQRRRLVGKRLETQADRKIVSKVCEVPKALITLKKKKSHWPLSNSLVVIGVQNMAAIMSPGCSCHLLYGKEWLSRLVSITHCGADVDIIKRTDEDNFAFFFLGKPANTNAMCRVEQYLL